MRIRHQFEAEKRIVLLEKYLLLGQFEEVVCAVLNVAVGRDDETAGARPLGPGSPRRPAAA
jgi:hypothetical protein